MRLYISKHLHLDTGRVYYVVVEDDGWKYPMYGKYKTEQEAEERIKELTNESC